MSMFPKSMELFERAARVIPGGIYGHMSPAATVPLEFPYFAREARGCRYKDVDGREYIDFMCGYGPIVLGYHDEEVEAEAERQRREGDCLNHPSARTVELAERLVRLVGFAGWAVLGKNGSDMTTWAMQVAREFTKRKKVLVIEGAYHGWHAWCTPGHGGLIEEDREHIHSFKWNDLEGFHDKVKKYRDKIAGVMITPFHHPTFADSVMPAAGFLQGIEAMCRKEGMVLILDDIRAGFRLDLRGSHRVFGFEPDMACYSKAMGNGYAISAAVGREELKVAASKVFLTGSFWNGAVAMAASLGCLKALEERNAVVHMRKMGEMLARGLTKSAGKYGFKIKVSGPAAAPFISFEGEKNFALSQKFAVECVKRGVFFHPHHNWFLCAAHQEKDIKQTVEVADEAFSFIKQ